MKRLIYANLITLTALLNVTAGIMAQTTKKAATTQKKPAITTADHKFVHDAAIGGMAEVEMGKLAATRASNADVKAFGQRMVDDHSKAGDELKQLASQKSITLPTVIDAKDKATMERL